MPKIILDNNEINYEITRSIRAKGLAIIVSPVSGVCVRMPLTLKRYINPEEILIKNKKWLLGKIKSLQVTSPKQPLQAGSTFFYLGEEVTINLIRKAYLTKPKMLFDERRLDFFVNETTKFEDSDFRNNIKKFLKQRAKQVISEIVEQQANRMELSYKKIVIRDQKTKWGSCSESGNLNFNWRLIMMPRSIIEYLATHELAHLVHFNHSKIYWELVGKFSPNYKQHEQWLKTEGLRITSYLL